MTLPIPRFPFSFIRTSLVNIFVTSPIILCCSYLWASSPYPITIPALSWPLSTIHNQRLTRRLYYVECTQYSIRPKRSAICNRCFNGPTRVVDANGISITSAIFCRAHKVTDQLTDWPTDHTTRSVTIGRAHSGEAKFCYCLWLQQVFIAAVDLTDRINFSNQQLYSAMRQDGLRCCI